MLPRYDPTRSYRWNYQHAPQRTQVEVPPYPGAWQFCGKPVGSPLGIPAGPLLNGQWCLYYADLGFDVLTYKTVRSRQRDCYDLPNLLPVDCQMLRGSESDLRATDTMQGSWAVSFGMPSAAPDVWRADVRATRDRLHASKLLSVSVVGTVQPEWTVEQLADDYAQCARWAAESGADCMETNFSCPNVSTCDGQLFQQPRDARLVAERVRQAIGPEIPYIIKIGHLHDREAAIELIEATAPFATALASTNSIATTIVDASGKRYFKGQKRGICGAATREASIRQVNLLRDEIERRQAKLELIGVGGAESAEHVRQYLDAGASAVHLATVAMLDPEVAIKIRREERRRAEGRASRVASREPS